MEDRRLLGKWRRFFFGRPQRICVAIAIMLTFIPTLVTALKIEFPHNTIGWLLFFVCLVLGLPGMAIAGALGLGMKGESLWQWVLLEFAVNAVIGYAIGTVFGLIVKATDTEE